MPVCWNWQTRQTQNLLSARACGFESHHRHSFPEDQLREFFCPDTSSIKLLYISRRYCHIIFSQNIGISVVIFGIRLYSRNIPRIIYNNRYSTVKLATCHANISFCEMISFRGSSRQTEYKESAMLYFLPDPSRSAGQFLLP